VLIWSAAALIAGSEALYTSELQLVAASRPATLPAQLLQLNQCNRNTPSMSCSSAGLISFECATVDPFAMIDLIEVSRNSAAQFFKDDRRISPSTAFLIATSQTSALPSGQARKSGTNPDNRYRHRQA